MDILSVAIGAILVLVGIIVGYALSKAQDKKEDS